MKRLFTNINVDCGVSNNDYYKGIVEELKKCSWEKLPDNKFLCVSVDWLTFYKMTAIDYRYFEEKNIDFRYEIFFKKLPDGQFEYEVNFYEKEERQYDDYLIVETDDLELFTEEKPEDLSEEEIIKKLSSALTLATDNLDIDRIIDLIDNNFADVSNRMREKFCESLVVDDIDNDDLKDEIGREWAENNTEELKNIYLDNASSYELKEMATDIINDYL